MTKEQYSSLPLTELRAIAKARGLKSTTSLRKAQLIDRMVEEDQKEEAAEEARKKNVQAREEARPQKSSPVSEEPRQQKNSPVSEEPRQQKNSPVSEESRPQKRRASEQTNRRRNSGGSRRSSGNHRDTEAHRESEGSREQNGRSDFDSRREQDNHGQSENRRENTDNRRDSAENRREQNNRREQVRYTEISDLDSGEEVEGILEVLADGYGFIRSKNFLSGEDDVYVSPSQIRKFMLRTGDYLCGNTRIRSQNEKYSALLYVKSINGLPPEMNRDKTPFEDLTPVFPNERIHLERQGGSLAMRIVDLISPIGKGQRGMIVSPPKAGKTTLLKEVAKSVLTNNPEMRVIILLIDERPEEVTDMKETVRGDNVEVVYSTFDDLPEHHRKVSEMVIEHAKRLVESGQDVIILIDSITRLARAYNQLVPPSGRTLSGGLDPAALHMPKRFFGAARNMREGGSLTILATALVDTGSKMDDVVYEEFKGTGNMELILNRKLQERRVFPAIDIAKSGTRREDLLLSREEMEAVNRMRRALNGLRAEEAGENIINMFAHTRTNADLVQLVRRQKVF